MIQTIRLKFGSAPTQAPVQFDVAPVTVFVGPNNSGKSKVLQEIHRFCTVGLRHPADLILDALTFVGFPPEQAPAIAKSLTLPPRKKDVVNPGSLFIGKHQHRYQVREEHFLAALEDPNTQSAHFCKWYLAFHALMLDGKSRVTSVNEQDATDLQEPPENVLDILFRDDAKRGEVRRIVHDAFGDYFVVDPTALRKLRIRLSRTEPEDPRQERGIHEEAVSFHGSALDIADASDGVKAFTGIITQIVAGDPSIILIDDPEAFLHPGLSFKLGKDVAISAHSSDKRLFVSTHSANFVMGCIQSGAPTNIIRLTYQHDVPTARILPNDKLLRLMRNPLLRSTGVLEGLFYGSVIVTESDSDRVFYQEINERLLRSNPDRGVPNCLFLNAQNKQTIHHIVRPLRQLGIPAAGIVDVDILKDGGKSWTGFLDGGFIPEVSHIGLGQTRSAIRGRCEDSGKDMKRDGGIAILSDADQEAARTLFNQLAEYGLFVVHSGVLESWLKPLGVTGHGPSWVIDIFEKMGEDPDDPTYVTPEKSDVWAFLERIGTWLKNPARNGIPT